MNDDITIDFLCAGAAKSGTTALHRYLRAHPQVYMPLKKEIHHFADDILRPEDYWLKPEAFFGLYKYANTTKLLGESSVFYMISENAAKNIYAHNPKAKIIMILRNPVELAYSLHSQLVFNGEENISDFWEALKAEEQRKAGKHLPEKTRILKKHFYTEVGKYAAQIRRFTDVFPAEQIKIVLYDDFKKDTAAAVKDIYRFLDVDEGFEPNFKKHNANKVIRFRSIQKITDTFSHRISARILSPDRAEELREYLLRLNSKKEQRKPLLPETKRYLQNLFKDDIQVLEDLIQRDLSSWYKEIELGY